jgi:hypothetical protein
VNPVDLLPRLLIVSQTVPTTGSGGGVVLCRMLRDYPPERLLVIGPEALATGERLPCRYEWVGRVRDRLYRTRFNRWLHAADAFGLLPHSVGGINRRLRGFQPQVVLTIMEGYLYRTAQQFARRHRIPLAMIIHDRPDLLTGVPAWATASQRRVEAEAYRCAAVRLCVSPEMEAHCRRAYGAPGEVLYPARSPAITPRPAAESATLREPGVLRLAFAGSLGLGYGAQLRAMLDTFRAAGAKLYLHGRPGSGTPDLVKAAPDVVIDRGFAPTPEQTWDRVKRDCDAVILPYGLDPDPVHRGMYATHFPSKLTDYTALGMPLVIVGPSYAAGVQWALQRPGSALVISDKHPGRLQTELTRLRGLPDWRVQLASGALAAGTVFDTGAIARQFLAAITTSASAHSNAVGTQIGSGAPKTRLDRPPL